MKNILFKPLNYVDYNTFKMAKYVTLPFGFASSLSGICADNVLLCLMGCFCVYLDLYINRPEAVYHVKNLNELNALYQCFLDNYHQLNEMVGLKNPLEIMLLYTMLLKNGYLSVGKKHGVDDPFLEHSALARFQVFTGDSVCRHDAILLRDILKREKIKSSILLNYRTSCHVDEEEIEKYEELKRKLDVFNSVANYNRNEFLDLCIYVEQLIDKGIINDSMFHLSERPLIGNHAITLARDNGKGYYLDPSNNQIYRKRNIDGRLVLSDGLSVCIPITSPIESKFYTDRCEKISQVRSFLKGLDVSLQEEKLARSKICNLYQGNKDIWDRFYSDNSSLYGDINENLDKAKAKMRVRTRFYD